MCPECQVICAESSIHGIDGLLYIFKVTSSETSVISRHENPHKLIMSWSFAFLKLPINLVCDRQGTGREQAAGTATAVSKYKQRLGVSTHPCLKPTAEVI